MIELDRRALITGLAAVVAAGSVPALPIPAAASPGPPASPVHRLFLHDDDPATRWQFLEPTTDHYLRYSVKELMPTSLWDFDAHLEFEPGERLFSIRHVASGITFRQVHFGTPAVRFDYWDMTADDRPSWVDTTDITILGNGAVYAVAAILARANLIERSPFQVRFWAERFSCNATPIIASVAPASPLDHYAHTED